MKVLDTDTVFHSSGVIGKFDYEVASTAKMMNMLSNSLYKDKIAAVLRELGTNARDSHIAAKQSRVFDVTLPSRTVLELRIRDYGTGMAPEKLEKMYRVYGASDKTDSNDFNGCMGIGSKSPFSYASSFTSISYHNGKKYTYINAKDERGIPSLNRISVEDTTQPNGLEIVVPVKMADVDTFANKAKLIYRPFPIGERPNVKTMDGRVVVIESHKYQMNGPNWGFIGKGDRYTNNSNSFVIMGCVEYPIDIQHFVKTNDPATNAPSWYNNGGAGIDTDYSKLIRMGLNLFCNIGDVEMDISREGLQYTKQTVAHIKGMLDVALKEIKAEIGTRFANCQTMWEARILYRDLIRGDLSGLREIVELSKPEFKGTPIEMNVEVDHKKLGIEEIICFSGRGNDRAYKNVNVNYLEAEKDISFIENDLDKGAHAACSRLCNTVGNRKVYLVKFNTPADKQKFADHFGFDISNIKLASSLPKPQRQARGPVEKVFKHLGNHSVGAANWQACDVDIEDGGFYVEINAWKPLLGTEQVSAASISHILDSFKALGIAVPHSEIIGVKTIGVKKFVKKPAEWTNFFDWAKNELDKHLKQCKMSDDVALVNEVDEISNKVDKFLTLSKVKNPDAKVDSLFYKFTDSLTTALDKKQKLQAKISAAISASNVLGLVFDNSAKQATLDKQMQSVLVKYPMLDMVERWQLSDKVNHGRVVSYINLVDTCG